MKKIPLCLLVLSCLGCGENRNETMTKFINEKKSLEGRLLNTNRLIDDINNKNFSKLDTGLIVIGATANEDELKRNFDTFQIITAKIKQVNFSIDSLSKME